MIRPIAYLFSHTETILTVLKDTGYVGAGVGVIYGVGRWLATRLTSTFRTVRETNTAVNLLMANHLPHITDAVDAQGASLRGLKSDVRELDIKMIANTQRLEDTKLAVHTIGESFLRHLESASKESAQVVAVQPVMKTRRRHAV